MSSRLAIGLVVDAARREARGTLVRVDGAGLDCRVESLAAAAVAELVAPRVELAATSAAAGIAADRNAESDAPIESIMVEAIRTVAARAGTSLDHVLVLGVQIENGSSLLLERGAGTAARLAETTGITTVAGFSERDHAAGGRGRPLDAICDWIVTHDEISTRLVAHIDNTSSLCIVPARCGPRAVRVSETGPGVVMLDSLVSALTQGRQPSDRRGMLAVQGRQIKPLIRSWATHRFFQQTPPRVVQPDDFGDSFIAATLQMTVECGWSVADVLCTATHFVAACPADAVRQQIANDFAAEQVIVVGKGAQNGLLLRLVEDQFTGLGVVTAPLAKIPAETYSAVCAAMLACLTLDGVPANLPGVTGAAGSRLLGQITPGTSRNWSECLEWMHQSARPAAVRAA